MNVHATAIAIAAALLCAAPACLAASGELPRFEATSLTGETVTQERLMGHPSVLIVTPSREAADATKAWARALQQNLDLSSVRVRDIIAIDLPFFMSEEDALGRARDKVDQKFYDRTWLLNSDHLEEALNVPVSSDDAYVLVLDAQGDVVARTHGSVTDARINEIQNAVTRLTGVEQGDATADTSQ